LIVVVVYCTGSLILVEHVGRNMEIWSVHFQKTVEWKLMRNISQSQIERNAKESKGEKIIVHLILVVPHSQ
jgi:hypothetical protein